MTSTPTQNGTADEEEINARLDSLKLNDEGAKKSKSKKRSPRTVRQFACGDCDRVWWEGVPEDEQASECRNCNKIYKPIDREDEYGWAVFSCDCGNQFSGFGQKHKTSSECYKCKARVLADSVHPRGPGDRKSESSHQCDAPDCYRKNGKISQNHHDKNMKCVHPRSRQGKRVIVASETY